jgi:hypothetical protein
VNPTRDFREVAEVEAWFHRRGMRVEVDKTSDEWFVTVTDASGRPVLVTGRGATKLEALNDAQAFLA